MTALDEFFTTSYALEMAENPQIKNVAMRKNISLVDDDAELLDKLKASIEKRLKIKIKDVQVVRMALREFEVIELLSHR